MSRRVECPNSGKRIFWTESLATKAIHKGMKRNVFFTHYKCQGCSYWHLATNRKKKREKPDERLSD